MMHRSCFSCLALAVVLGANVTLCLGQSTLAKKPINFVFFLVDDLGYMDIGANNPDCFYDTPNVDRLTRSGMRFTNGYAACPVCSPTRLSIMTGKYPSRTDATNCFSGKRAERFAPAPLHDRMDLEEVTLAEALKEHGYATFFAGKWHLGPTEEFWPQHQGFDVNKGGWKRGGPYGPGKYFVPYGNPRLEDGPPGEHLPDRLAGETCQFIERHKDGRSLVPLLKGDNKLAREALYWHYPHYGNQGGFPGGAIRMGDWKLLERFEDGRVHLYNLAEDVGEKNDLAGRYPLRVKAMREKLHAWYQEVDAKFLRQREKAGGGLKPWRPSDETE